MDESELADLFIQQITTVLIIGIFVYLFKLWWDET
jgi:hypothetical protein